MIGHIFCKWTVTIGCTSCGDFLARGVFNPRTAHQSFQSAALLKRMLSGPHKNSWKPPGSCLAEWIQIYPNVDQALSRSQFLWHMPVQSCSLLTGDLRYHQIICGISPYRSQIAVASIAEGQRLQAFVKFDIRHSWNGCRLQEFTAASRLRTAPITSWKSIAGARASKNPQCSPHLQPILTTYHIQLPLDM